MAAKQTQRTHSIFVRVNPAELARFQKQAGREPLATWARRILLEHVERRERRERA
jgi:hypothetical protein